MIGRLMALALLGLAAAASAKTAPLIERRIAPSSNASAYGYLLPIAVLQKAELVEDLPNDPRFEAWGADGRLAPLDVGYAYREIRILWMPFFAWSEGGFVFFSRTDAGQYSIAPAHEIEFRRVANVIGHDPRAGYSFNMLAHMWGWLSLIPLAFAWRRYRRWDDERRVALGML